ncbi:MAG: cmpD2 [Paenibacillaceae bacterium]|jgi:NitT/TauT family transport system ATP-binding protein|nr:cmpD2 [Paenibacillaceae bacterium]
MLSLNGISKRYNRLEVMREFSIGFQPGRVHCLFGPSGCGKTTLLHLLAGLTEPDGGELQGVREESFSFVFQEHRLLPWLNVQENIRLVLESAMPRKEADSLALRELERVELAEFALAYPDELSGGMKQRVSIARALAYGGSVLLLDEPFKGLHHALKQTLFRQVLEYGDKGSRTILLVTHDPDEALQLADTVHVLAGPPLSIVRQFAIDIPRDQRQSEPERLQQYRAALMG